MSVRIPADAKILARIFSNRGIPTDQINFYNHPAFLAAERQDPSFLEFYAAWVRARRRDDAYDVHVRRVVPRMADIIADEIARDGQLGVLTLPPEMPSI